MGTDGWDLEADIVVAGAGPGGMTAALVAAIEGLEVMVCEKSAQVGGTGATSAGTLWIPGNRPSREAGYDDTPGKAAAYLDALIGDDDPGGLRRTYLESGPVVIDYLMAHSDVQFIPCGPHPDYRNNLPGAALEGRAIIPALFDGRKLGDAFRRVRPPIPEYLIFGGMMVGKADIMQLLDRYRSPRAFVHSAGLVLRYLFDRLRFPRGTRLAMGNALVARLFCSLLRRGVDIRFETATAELVREGGRVAGVVVDGPEGRQRILARRGVVLATGGFAHDPALRRQFMPAAAGVHSMAVVENTGDGLRLAEAAGARLGPRNDTDASKGKLGGLWSPVSRTRRRDGSEGLYPHIILDRAKPGLIAVNSAGRRFVNEAVSYHDFVEGMFRANETTPSVPAWLICDSAFVRKYGLGDIHPETRNLARHERAGYIVTAPDLETLADRIGVEAAGLADSVGRANRYAEAGNDPDFGKGDTELNRFNGDPAHRPNPCLGPIATPPFVAMEVWPAEIACSIGIAADADGRVLDESGRPIEGLYACGNDMSSVMGGSYPGPGTTLGPAMVFGYRAAMHAANKSAT